jgi:hypothetical protein
MQDDASWPGLTAGTPPPQLIVERGAEDDSDDLVRIATAAASIMDVQLFMHLVFPV